MNFNLAPDCIYAEPKIREPYHFEVFFSFYKKDMESKLISGVTSTCTSSMPRRGDGYVAAQRGYLEVT